MNFTEPLINALATLGIYKIIFNYKPYIPPYNRFYAIAIGREVRHEWALLTHALPQTSIAR